MKLPKLYLIRWKGVSANYLREGCVERQAQREAQKRRQVAGRGRPGQALCGQPVQANMSFSGRCLSGHEGAAAVRTCIL